jgi:hypothetical protein
LQDKHGNLVTSNADKAALINRYFSSVYAVDNGAVNAAKLPNPGSSTVAPPFLTPALVKKCIELLEA